MQFAILGPLEVRDDAGRPVDVAGARLRTLLTRLAVDAGHPVSAAALVDSVWGYEPPADAANALQTLVSRLRRALGGPAAIVATQAGYRLAAAREDVDAHRFADLAVQGGQALRAGDPARAAALLDDALALWRGAALADAGDGLDAQVGRWHELRLTARLDRVEAALGTGEAATTVAELEDLSTTHPLDERVAALLVRALAGSGRQADALQAYERVRGRLADELGVDPSARLQEVHLGALRGELAPGPPAAPARRTNLRAQLTSFVGRDDEVARIAKSLDVNRLVTLVGPGGAGKTRLAAEAGDQVADATADGVWFVELAPVTSGSDVAAAVLNSLGLRDLTMREIRAPSVARDAHRTLLDSLADKGLLIVLDNCEHVVDAAARLTDSLLAHCPDLRILATSREPLGIIGEVLLAVPPLGQPERDAAAPEALAYPAVRLFADRAAAARPDFVVDDDTVAAVIEIVRRLDGLPLAIELAAARLRTMPVDDIAARLDSRFRLLTGGSRTALPRHRTLHAVVEWSWDLLDDAERDLAERLCVFAAGVTEHSAAAVVDLDPVDLADLLASLADKSLLQPVDGGRRMRMLETIREFGAERLAERALLGEVRAAHAAYFARELAAAQPHLLGREQVPYFAWIEAERENVLAALRYLGDIGDADAALHIALDLSAYSMMIGAHAELGGWLGEALAVPGGTDPELRLILEALHLLNSTATGVFSAMPADQDVLVPEQQMADYARRLMAVDNSRTPMLPMIRAVLAFFSQDVELADVLTAPDPQAPDDWTTASIVMLRASLAENEGDLAALRVLAPDGLARFRRIGERWGLANSLRTMANIHTLDGDLDAALEAFAEARRLAAELKSRDDESFMLGQLAELEVRRGNLDAARRYAEEARATAEAHGEIMSLVFVTAMIGSLEEASGNLDAARELNEQAVTRMRHLPDKHPAMGHVRALTLMVSARLGAADGDLTRARADAADAYEAALTTKDSPIVAAVGTSIAHVLAEAGDECGAAEVLGACARLRGADDPTSPAVRPLAQRLRAALGDDAYAAAWERGWALDREAAIERLRPPA